MPLENKQIEAMASWTLEDFQNDPLGAMTQIRNLATDYIALQRERDELAAVKVELYTAVADLKEITMERPGLPTAARRRRGRYEF